MTAVVTVPGIYDLPDDVYHADPVAGGSLSSTGARKLLPPSCPARFLHDRENPEQKAVFDFGSAAHKLILESGPTIRVVDADDWRTIAAKQQRDEARAAGQVPILRDDYARIQDMVDAIRAHPFAYRLFDPALGGRAEQSLFWEGDGIWKRARLDWLPARDEFERVIVPDYKTCASADPGALAKAVANFGYHQQAAWYIEAVEAVADVTAQFVFVAQEKTPPYLVTVFELDREALRAGRERNARACEIYRDCTAAGVWPAYSSDVELIALPRWASYLHEMEYA